MTRAETTSRPIVVAMVDSAEARAAARWASVIAARDKHPLVLLHADSTTRYEHRVGTYLDNLLESTAQTLLHAFPDLDLDVRVIGGFAPHVLLDYSSAAEMVVLGRDVEPGNAHMRIGSVTSTLVNRSSCRLAIVRSNSPLLARRRVIMVTDTLSPATVFASGFREARARAVPAAILESTPSESGWQEAIRGSIYGPSGVDVVTTPARLASWQRTYPDVDVEIIQTHHTHTTLAEESSSATLVVLEGGPERGDLYGRHPYALAEYAVLNCAADLLVVPLRSGPHVWEAS